MPASASHTPHPTTGGFERAPQRIAILATASGSGKTILAQRLSALLDLPHTELDAIHHQADWVPLEADAFVASLKPIVASERWVIDGGYQSKLGDLVVERADLVIWLDLSTSVWLPRLLRRTARRILTKEVLWQGNRETLRDALLDREGVIWFAVRSARRRRKTYPQRLAPYPTRRLRTPGEVEELVAELKRAMLSRGASDH